MTDPQDVAESATAAMWAGDRASQALGMEILEVGPGRAVLRMAVREDMVNGHAIGHGGLTFTLADSAFAFACNSYGRRTVAAGAEIRFRAPTRLGDVLTATATERSRDGKTGVYDVEVSVRRRAATPWWPPSSAAATRSAARSPDPPSSCAP